MQAGYLIVETHPAQPQMIRLRRDRKIPAPAADPSGDTAATAARTLYVARFDDLDAAMMHFQQGLRRRLVDSNARLYRASLTEAVAVADAIALQHRTVFVDPQLARDPALAVATEARRSRQARVSRLFDWIGFAALLLLIALASSRL